jgi:outer membrane protein assembly factor BamB
MAIDEDPDTIDKNPDIKDGKNSKESKNSQDNDNYKIDSIIQEADGLKYSIETLGGTILEDGVTIILVVYNESNDVAWVESWNGVEVTELTPFSKVTKIDDTIFIVVDRTLYAFNAIDGDVRWELDIGTRVQFAPIIDEGGNIYLISERKPYLRAVSKDGVLKWQLNSDKLYGIYDIEFADNKIIAKMHAGERGEYIIDNYKDLIE